MIIDRLFLQGRTRIGDQAKADHRFLFPKEQNGTWARLSGRKGLGDGQSSKSKKVPVSPLGVFASQSTCLLPMKTDRKWEDDTGKTPKYRIFGYHPWAIVL